MTKCDNHRRERASQLMKSGGYKRGGSIKKEVKNAVHKHEKHDHPGKPLTKLKKGGTAHGKMPKKRLDKPSRKGHEEEVRKLASGGKASKGGKGATVNIVIAGDKGGANGQAGPMAAGPRPPMPAAMPPKPPMGPPPGAPAGGPPMGGSPGLKRGGKVSKEYPISAGSGGGEGRLQKAAAQRKHHGGPKKRGGKCS